MAVIKMKALTLIGPNEEMETVARQMVIMGGFQPLPMDLILDDRSLRSRVNTETSNPYDDMLVKLSVVWKAAGETIPEPFPVPLDGSFTRDCISKEVDTAASRLDIWDTRREVLTEELDQMQAARVLVKAMAALGRKQSDIIDTKYAILMFGRVTDENYAKLIDSSEAAPLVVLPLNSRGGRTWGIVITVPGYVESTKKLLDTVYFKEYSLEEISGKLDLQDPLGMLDQGIEQHQKAVTALAKAAKGLLKDHREQYETLYSRAYTMQRVYDLCKGRGEVSGLYVLSGWIPGDTLESVRETVARDAPKSAIMVEESGDLPYKGITVPTMLNNLPFVRAFQEIVGLYSLPSYGEIDPSFIVAITFSLFFGFMFGDVGHGMMLFGAAMYAKKKGLLKRSFATIMKTAGVMSIVFGFLYGSIFGLEHVIPALWMSPMENAGKLIGIAVGFGVVMISVGMILNMVGRYREGDIGKLLFDGQGLAGLVFYWTAAGLVFASITNIKLPFPTWVPSLILGILLLVILLRDVLARLLLGKRSGQGHTESWGLHVFEVCHSMLNFVSNTASFVRLAAFALNHVGLSLAVLMLADMVHTLPGGLFFKGLILVIGNIVIVALEGLIVFIQTLRLEYYEFFSKFYRGGGKNFRPVGWSKPEKVRAKV